MPKPLNPLIVARLRKYWMYPEPEKLDNLFCELDGWVYLLGPGPAMPICNNCRCELSFDWRLCPNCSEQNLLCNRCYECYNCEIGYASEGCSICGSSCGAYVCRYCKISND